MTDCSLSLSAEERGPSSETIRPQVQSRRTCSSFSCATPCHWALWGAQVSMDSKNKQADLGRILQNPLSTKLTPLAQESPWPADPQQLASILGSSITQLFWLWEASQGIHCWPLFQPRYRHGFNISHYAPYSPAPQNWALFSPEVDCEILNLLESYCWLSGSAEKCFMSRCCLRDACIT